MQQEADPESDPQAAKVGIPGAGHGCRCSDRSSPLVADEPELARTLAASVRHGGTLGLLDNTWGLA